MGPFFYQSVLLFSLNYTRWRITNKIRETKQYFENTKGWWKGLSSFIIIINEGERDEKSEKYRSKFNKRVSLPRLFFILFSKFWLYDNQFSFVFEVLSSEFKLVFEFVSIYVNHVKSCVVYTVYMFIMTRRFFKNIRWKKSFHISVCMFFSVCETWTDRERLLYL
jgi:hypothetical protein